MVRCALGNVNDAPHVSVVRNLGDPGVIDCSQGCRRRCARGPRGIPPNEPDYEGAI